MGKKTKMEKCIHCGKKCSPKGCVCDDCYSEYTPAMLYVLGKLRKTMAKYTILKETTPTYIVCDEQETGIKQTICRCHKEEDAQKIRQLLEEKDNEA